jgi:hypothetical protein
MCRADDRAQIVGILDPVENNVHPSTGDGFFERRKSLRRSKSDNTLMLGGARHGAIQHFTRLETHWNLTLPRQIDNFLDARPGGPLGDQNSVERAPGP